MQISRQALQRLQGIDWFRHAGTPTRLEGVRQLADRAELDASLDSEAWEATTLEARNEITGRLARLFPHQSTAWNDLAKQAHHELQALWPRIPMDLGTGNSLLADLQWILLAYLLEDAYRAYLKPPLFFDGLIGIYEAGHLPCGWDGQWPEGRLVVY